MLGGARDSSRPGGGGDHVVVNVVQRCADHHGDDLQYDAPPAPTTAEDARRLLERQGVDPAELSREIGDGCGSGSDRAALTGPSERKETWTRASAAG